MQGQHQQHAKDTVTGMPTGAIPLDVNDFLNGDVFTNRINQIIDQRIRMGGAGPILSEEQAQKNYRKRIVTYAAFGVGGAAVATTTILVIQKIRRDRAGM